MVPAVSRVTCVETVKDPNGEIIVLRCTYAPATKGGDSPDGRKVKGTLHWVSAEHGVEAEVRLYDRLFAQENPEADGEFLGCINPDSLQVITGCLEPELAKANPGERFQFERTGYFVADAKDSAEGRPVFNRIVSLRDSWAKIAKKS